ncbi:hypothetical protein MKD38_26155 [Cupriavidus sp. WGlv3]|uniref:hypothetical protein n=1 Tax=Cupriavidus sp. WGlv3 TaxID=2919924 RepID=UPI002090241D|nr:hypothetical protein [Cupriavidus sp. WGlv3]MCO4865183.1 hypothetical protein [Cupriavidus sp. WGlv3]
MSGSLQALVSICDVDANVGKAAHGNQLVPDAALDRPRHDLTKNCRPGAALVLANALHQASRRRALNAFPNRCAHYPLLFFADPDHFSAATYFLQGAIISGRGASRNIW